MSLTEQSLNFGSEVDAGRWFEQLRTQWVVTSTKIETDPRTGYIVATAWFAVKDRALVRAHEEDE
jgi:hypothetical protein